MPPFLIYAKMSLGFMALPNFVHVKLKMCQGKTKKSEMFYD